MSPRSVANLAIKIVGILTLVDGLRYLHSVIGGVALIVRGMSAGVQSVGAKSEDVMLTLAYNLLGLFLYLAVGRWLIVRSSLLARRLLPVEGPQRLAVDSEKFQAVVFSAIGLYVLVLAIPPLTDLFALMAFTRQTGSDAYTRSFLVEEFWGKRWAAAASLAVQIGLGLYLFLGSKGLAAFWHRL
jgi:hypothetical protein